MGEFRVVKSISVRRRDFIAKLAGTAIFWPIAGLAQKAMPVIGFLHPGTPEAYAEFVAAFRKGLDEAGYVEGKNVAIEFRWARNRNDRLAQLAAELVERKVDVIATASATSAALAAQHATSTIPIVFAIGADPVKFKLVASLNRPGGNLTGISFLANTLVSKQLELLRDLVPSATVVGVLINPTNPNAVYDTRNVRVAASSLGRHVEIARVKTAGEFDAAFRDLAQKKIAALLVFPDTLFISRRQQLVTLAARHKMPAIYSSRPYAEAGGLISYGSSQSDVYHQLAAYTGRILRGERPAELPVQESTKFELVINTKAARELGINVPQSILARADQVIE